MAPLFGSRFLLLVIRLAGSDSEHRVASTANHWHLGNARNRTRRSELVAWNTLVFERGWRQTLGIYGSQIFHKRCWDALNTKCGNMYIFVYIHTSIHACIHPCMHACIHTYIHTCMFETCLCLHHFFKPYIMQIDQFSALASGSSSKLCLAVFTKGWGWSKGQGWVVRLYMMYLDYVNVLVLLSYMHSWFWSQKNKLMPIKTSFVFFFMGFRDFR